MTFKNIFFFILIIPILHSCSSTQSPNIKKKRLSVKKKVVLRKPLTPREKALLYYKKLREARIKNLKNRKIEILQIKEFKKVSTKKTHPVHIDTPPPIVPEVDIDEQKIEISQRVTYYCIKNRIEKESCQDAVLTKISHCFNKYDNGNKNLTDCVKINLR